VVLTAVLGHDSEGRVDGTVPGRFNVEEERGTDVDEDAEDVEEGVRWRRMRRRSGCRRVCDREMTGLGFIGSGTHQKKNSHYI
jgi:hypothetical protein